MGKDLEAYNHLNYQEQEPKDQDEFVSFLFQNTDLKAPEVDENEAWNKLIRNISQKREGFSWMKIAATVSILAIISISIFLYNPAPSMVQVASVDQKTTVNFPDGSVGVLNANSSFTYPEKFGDQRAVSFKGEAYFDIVKSDKPFVIDVNGVNVQVLGTAFNLITTDSEVKLYVDRGLVAFEKDGEQTKVSAGKEAIFNKKDLTVSILDAPSSNIMSWRNGKFNFDQTPLSEALNELGQFYQVQFKLSNDGLNACKISATFDNQPLNDVLKTIGTVLDVKTSRKEDTVKISGKGC